MRRHAGGFSTLEYAVMIATVAIALIAMQSFVQRAVSGKYKSCADVFGSGRQYDAKDTTITP